MKDKIKEMTSRDKVILVVFLFFLVFAGMYMMNGKLQEKKVELQTDNSALEIKRKIALESKMEIDGIELILNAKKEEIGAIYSKVPDNIYTSIDFETLFLGWIEGRNVEVDSFSYKQPESERVVFDETSSSNPEDDLGDPLNIIAEEVDELEGVVSDDDFIEEDGTGGVESDLDIGDADDFDDSAAGEMEETSPESAGLSINFSTYNYELTLTRYEYTRLLDKINDKSEFYQLEKSEFREDEDGSVRGRGTFNIKVYSYNKPKSASKESN